MSDDLEEVKDAQEAKPAETPGERPVETLQTPTGAPLPDNEAGGDPLPVLETPPSEGQAETVSE